MLELLGELVNIDSGSYDKAGVEAVGQRLIRFFEEQGLLDLSRAARDLRRRHPCPPRRQRAPTRSPIVLMGHRDTVFPKGEAARRPFRIDNGRAYGPGVCDMKSGLVMNAFVLAAFKRFGGAPAPARRPDHQRRGDRLAVIAARHRAGRRAAPAAFSTAEPGRPSGNVVTGRKGGVFLRFEVSGKAAHSGGNFEKGISAIGEIGAQDRRHA